MTVTPEEQAAARRRLIAARADGTLAAALKELAKESKPPIIAPTAELLAILQPWLEERDRRVAEKAWDAGHNHCFHVEDPNNRERNPHRAPPPTAPPLPPGKSWLIDG